MGVGESSQAEGGEEEEEDVYIIVSTVSSISSSSSSSFSCASLLILRLRTRKQRYWTSFADMILQNHDYVSFEVEPWRTIPRITTLESSESFRKNICFTTKLRDCLILRWNRPRTTQIQNVLTVENLECPRTFHNLCVLLLDSAKWIKTVYILHNIHNTRSIKIYDTKKKTFISLLSSSRHIVFQKYHQ